MPKFFKSKLVKTNVSLSCVKLKGEKEMSKIAVVYWSGTGNTEVMANAVVDGAKAAGAEVTLFKAAEFSADKVGNFDAIGFGCPSMGVEVLEESEFDPMFESCESKLKGKKIALFGSYGWGSGEWMEEWEKRCENDGAVFATDYVICVETPDDEAIESCKELGKALVK